MNNVSERKNLLERISVRIFGKDYDGLTYTEMMKVASTMKKAITIYNARVEHGFV